MKLLIDKVGGVVSHILLSPIFVVIATKPLAYCVTD
jgi:hypothetical protein